MAQKTGDSVRGRSHAVHRALKRAILDQALSPGAKLPEDSIGERLGVSRTLVREALVRLSEEGLVDLRPNKGATVARPTLEEGRNLFLTRVALERLVVETLVGSLMHSVLFVHDAHSDEALRDLIELVLVGAANGGATNARKRKAPPKPPKWPFSWRRCSTPGTRISPDRPFPCSFAWASRARCWP